MARAGPRKGVRYGAQFKATAVKLSSLPGVRTQDVAAALDIHPFIYHGGANRSVKKSSWPEA